MFKSPEEIQQEIYPRPARHAACGFNGTSVAPVARSGHSDLVLDEPFIGKLGSQQYNQRANIDPVPPATKIDADGVLQWHANRFLAGEMFRINMYYDAFRSFAK